MKQRTYHPFSFFIFLILLGCFVIWTWGTPLPCWGHKDHEGTREDQVQAVNPAQGAQEGAEFYQEYSIGPKDLLEIKVFELPELNQTVRVSEEGSITLPLLGNVKVEGMTKDTVESTLKRLLEKKWLKNAQVSVFIKEYQSKQVAVIGAVENPGMYELVGRLNLLQVISQAGGFRENASDEIFVLREGNNGMAATLAIDLEELMLNGNQMFNIPLQPGDVVNVPADTIINVYVLGAVRNPGALNVKRSKGITLLQAIAQAGGIAEGGSKSGVTIKRRMKDGKEIKMEVNIKDIIKGKKVDVELEEGDVVYVAESIF